MSTSSSWINRLERLLDLREFPNLKPGFVCYAYSRHFGCARTSLITDCP